MNIVLITSVINTPNLPLSYTNNRSVYSKSERFEQTKKTIALIKEKIPNCLLFLIECSQLNVEERDFLISNVDIFVNIFDTENMLLINDIYSRSKSLGEGTMTIHALQYLKEKNIDYKNLFKISGRYWLTNNFDYNNFDNENIVVKYIDGNINNCITSLYKLPKKNIDEFLAFLLDNLHLMKKCIGYEILFALFLKNKPNIISLNTIGISGLIAVSNDFYNG